VSSSITRGSATRWLVLATLVVLGLFGSLADRAFLATVWAYATLSQSSG
jgi:hypothetical protein